ncbi:MAG: DNA polymerase IV [Christensenellaceae bacterium]|nr:DNA polymerase IV [Christensenellaceae bacterium]
MADRTILHCDCNNFYASVELLERPDLMDKPVAVAGDPEGRHGIILAKNQIAKGYGVKTAETIWQARKKCPGLVLLPPHREKYSAMSARVNAIYLDVTDQVEPFSVDESWLDVTGSRALFGDGAAIADMLRRRVREELGITISVGVSDNKSWAKMGSDYKKPDATTLVTRENASSLLYPLPVSDLLFVGHAAAETLRRHGIGTIGALADCSPELLVQYLGKQGESLWRMARGLDDSPVRRWGESEPIKSIGNSTTFSHDLIGREACHAGLKPLCESVGTRLRQQGLKCHTVTIQIKDPQFKVISRQKTLPLPTNLTRQLYREACALLDASWPERAPVRLLSVTAGSLCPENDAVPAQLSFLEEVAPDDPRQLRLEKAIDRVRERYGQGIVGTGPNEKA